MNYTQLFTAVNYETKTGSVQLQPAGAYSLGTVNTALADLEHRFDELESKLRPFLKPSLSSYKPVPSPRFHLTPTEARISEILDRISTLDYELGDLTRRIQPI